MDTITIRLGKDTQQLADMQAIKISAHNMAASALDFAKNGSIGYDQYLNSQKEFNYTVDSLLKNYKFCEINM
jgi:hypothetical protein